MKYYLMNKDEQILSFTTEECLGDIVVKEGIRYSKHLPKGFTDITTWLDKRNYTKHKEYFRKWLQAWNLDTIDGFIETTHCLGINDCLWVKQVGSSLNWSDVSLYTNDFDDVAAHTAFENGLYGLQLSSTSPEFTAEGSFPKFWKRERDEIYLYKAGMSGAINLGKEPYAEYISSMLVSQFIKQPTVSYDLVKYKSKLCSKCRLFTTEDTGFIPMYQFLDKQRSYRIADVINICKELGYEEECAAMFYADSFVFNQDRHLGNFGFLVNNDDFSIKGFAPLFDFNVSMLCNATDEDLDNIIQYMREYQIEHKLGGSFQLVGEALRKQYGFSMPNAIKFPIHAKYNMSTERNDKLTRILEANAKFITGKQVRLTHAK